MENRLDKDSFLEKILLNNNRAGAGDEEVISNSLNINITTLGDIVIAFFNGSEIYIKSLLSKIFNKKNAITNTLILQSFVDKNEVKNG